MQVCDLSIKDYYIQLDILFKIIYRSYRLITNPSKQLPDINNGLPTSEEYHPSLWKGILSKNTRIKSLNFEMPTKNIDNLCDCGEGNDFLIWH